MEQAIATLEQKLDQVMGLCDRLLAENHALRAQLAGAEHETNRLVEQMAVARSRLEALLPKLPA